jgi:hypothetical protein
MATNKDLQIPRGQTIEFIVDVLGGPVSIEGYTGSMMIRELRHDAEPVTVVPAECFSCNAATRQVTAKIPGEVTTTIDLGEHGGVYDLLITGPLGDGWRLLEGRVYSSLAVTRED